MLEEDAADASRVENFVRVGCRFTDRLDLAGEEGGEAEGKEGAFYQGCGVGCWGYEVAGYGGRRWGKRW